MTTEKVFVWEVIGNTERGGGHFRTVAHVEVPTKADEVTMELLGQYNGEWYIVHGGGLPPYILLRDDEKR